MPKKNNGGGCRCCGPPDCTGHGNILSFGLSGCNGPATGASVTFTGTYATYSGTTDVDGLFTVTDPAPGTYTISWTYGATYSGTLTRTITDACSSASATDTLMGHVSTPSVCCPGCFWPRPATLYLTDVLGTATCNAIALVPASTGYAWTCRGSTILYTDADGVVWCILGMNIHCDGALSYVYGTYLAFNETCASITVGSSSTPSPCVETLGTMSGTYSGGPLDGTAWSYSP
jgi:hypothetical protein